MSTTVATSNKEGQLKPRVIDYLIGRPKFCRENGGNKFIRQLVEDVFEEYKLADKCSDYIDVGLKKDKVTITNEIMETFKASGGKFLKDLKGGKWVEVSRAVAKKRIVEEFRTVRKKTPNRKSLISAGPTIPSVVAVEGSSSRLAPVEEVAVEITTSASDEQKEESSSSSSSIQSENHDEKLNVHDVSLGLLHVFDIDDTIPASSTSSPDRVENGHGAVHRSFDGSDEISALGDDDVCADRQAEPKSPCTPRELRLESRTSNGGSSRSNDISSTPSNFSWTLTSSQLLKEPSFKSTPSDFSWTVTSSHLNNPLSVEDRLSNMSISQHLSSSQQQPASIGTFSHSSSSTVCPVVGFVPWYKEAAAAATIVNLPNVLAANHHKGVATSNIEIPQDVLRRALKEMKDIIASSEDYATEVVSFLVHHMTSASSPASESEYFRYVGSRVVMKAMEQYPTNELLQSRCCYALAIIVPKYDCKLAVVKNGGIHLLVKAMTDFRLNERLQGDVCHTLAILSRDQDNKVAIEKEGGIGLMLRTMRKYYSTQHQNLLLNCCWALANLATVERNRVANWRNGGIGLILKAGKGFSTNERLQQHVCLALGNLAHQNERNAKMIRDGGGEELVTKAMSAFKSSEEVVVRAFFALESFRIKPSVPDHKYET